MLALNEGANEHESRNAAVQACRLLHKHGLLAQLEANRPWSEPAPTVVAPPPPRPKRRPVRQPEEVSFNDFFVEFMKASQNVSAARARVSEDEVVPPPPQPHIPETSAAQRRPHDPEARSVPVLQPTWCPGCTGRIQHASYGMWSRGEIWHKQCFHEAFDPAPTEKEE